MSARNACRRGAAVVWAALLATPAAFAQEVTWSSSVAYTSGSYVFDDRYTSLSWLNALAFHHGRFRLSGSLPVVGQNGTAVSLIGGVPMPTGGPESWTVQRRQSGQTIPVRPGGRNSRMGSGAHNGTSLAVVTDSATDSMTVAGSGDYEITVGDPTFGAAFDLYEGRGSLRSFGVSAWTKAPIASVESGVGTGAWDYAAGASFSMSVGDVLVFGDATYWVLGDMDALELKDALFYSAAIGRRIGGDWSLLASLSASSRVVASLEPPASFGVSLSRAVDGRTYFNVGASAGLSESASDFSMYVGWSLRLLGR